MLQMLQMYALKVKIPEKVCSATLAYLVSLDLTSQAGRPGLPRRNMVEMKPKL